jgi:hypothetical protein
VDRYGYPLTLLADAGIGLLCLLCLAGMGTIRPRVALGAALKG